jgi:hypothetical protein
LIGKIGNVDPVLVIVINILGCNSVAIVVRIHGRRSSLLSFRFFLGFDLSGSFLADIVVVPIYLGATRIFNIFGVLATSCKPTT